MKNIKEELEEGSVSIYSLKEYLSQIQINISNLENFLELLSDKKRIAKDDYELYNSLLEVIIEEKDAELKTQSDVDTLQNSQKIKTIELKIFNLQEQIELLEIYSRIS